MAISTEYGINAKPGKEHDVYTELHHLPQVDCVVPYSNGFDIKIRLKSSSDEKSIKSLENALTENQNISNFKPLEPGTPHVPNGDND